MEAVTLCWLYCVFLNICCRAFADVYDLCSKFESRPVDVEYVRLMHDLQSLDIAGHTYRGYTLLTQDVRRVRSLKVRKQLMWRLLKFWILESKLKSLIWHLMYAFDIWYLTRNTFNEYLLFGLKHLQLMSVFHDRLYAADIPLLSIQYVMQNNKWGFLKFSIIFLSTRCLVVANIVGLYQFFCFSSFILSLCLKLCKLNV